MLATLVCCGLISALLRKIVHLDLLRCQCLPHF